MTVRDENFSRYFEFVEEDASDAFSPIGEAVTSAVSILRQASFKGLFPPSEDLEGRLEETLNLVGPLLKLEPPNEGHKNNDQAKGFLKLADKAVNVSDILKYLNKALSLAEASATQAREALTRRSRLLFDEHLYKEALESAREAIGDNGDQAVQDMEKLRLLHRQGQCLAKLHEYTKAVKVLKEALVLVTNSEEVEDDFVRRQLRTSIAKLEKKAAARNNSSCTTAPNVENHATTAGEGDHLATDENGHAGVVQDDDRNKDNDKFMSPFLKTRWSDQCGRFTIATMDVSPCQILIEEEPVVSLLNPDDRADFHRYCYRLMTSLSLKLFLKIEYIK